MCMNPDLLQMQYLLLTVNVSCLFQSDPDQSPGSPHESPSPTDDIFLGPASSPPGHAPPPPPYMPPQPTIEEARQQMHSLLDDAFALVSPNSQGSTSGITLPGVNTNPPVSSPLGRGSRPWGPSYQALCPFPGVSRHPSAGCFEKRMNRPVNCRSGCFPVMCLQQMVLLYNGTFAHKFP